MALMGEISGGAGGRREATPSPATGFLAAEGEMVAGAKKAALMCIGLAAQKYGEALTHEQEILGHFADLAMETYALESALLRTRKRAAARGEEQARMQEAAVRCFAQDALDRIEVSAGGCCRPWPRGTPCAAISAALARFTRRDPANTVALRRQVAGAAIEAGRYPFSS